MGFLEPHVGHHSSTDEREVISKALCPRKPGQVPGFFYVCRQQGLTPFAGIPTSIGDVQSLISCR